MGWGKLRVLSWNVDDIINQWSLFLLILEIYDPDIILLQETRLRRSQIFDLGNKCEGYRFICLLPEDLLKTRQERLKLSTKRPQYGLVIGLRLNDPTNVEVLKKEDN